MLVWCVRFYWFRVLGLEVFKGRGWFFPVLGPDKPATICPASPILHLLTTADPASRGHTRSIYADMWVVPRPSNPKPETLNPCTPTPHTCNPANYSSTLDPRGRLSMIAILFQVAVLSLFLLLLLLLPVSLLCYLHLVCVVSARA